MAKLIFDHDGEEVEYLMVLPLLNPVKKPVFLSPALKAFVEHV